MSYQSPVITPSGITFTQWQAAGVSGHLESLITANAAATTAPSAAATIALTGGGQSILNPTVAATVNATAGGKTVANPTVAATVVVGGASTGSLAAGTYYAAYTMVTPTGETTLGTSASVVFTVTAGTAPTVTIPALTAGATSANMYLSNVNGVNTAFALYARGVTGTTFVLNSSLYAGGSTFANGIAQPAANTCTGAMATASTGNYFGYTWVHAHGETTLGASVSTVTAIAAGNVPQVTIPALPTGAISANIYMSNTNGVNTALKLIMTGVTGTTANLDTATWNGQVFASAVSPPANNTTIGGMLPGAYLLNFTELDSNGETAPSTESASFTVTSQSNPSSALTAAGSSTGGSLPGGAYFGTYTYFDNNGGETTGGTAEVASATTIAGGQIYTATFNDTLPGWAAGRNFYLSTAGGASGSETLYATGITTATYVATSALWTNGTTTQAAAKPVPTANTTSVDIPRVTFPALQAGNLSRNVYVTAPGGATGTETFYAGAVSGLTFDLAVAVPANSLTMMKPPSTTATNPTSTRKYEYVRAAKTGALQTVYGVACDTIRDFNAGNPGNPGAVRTKLNDAQFVFAMLTQLCAEAGALLDANPGTIRNVKNAIGSPLPTRTWP